MFAVIEDEVLKKVVGIFEQRAIGATEMATRLLAETLVGASDIVLKIVILAFIE